MAIYEFNGIYPQLGRSVWIHEMAYVAGDVVLGEDVNVWPCASIRGDVARITIGARSNVQDGAVIHATHASPDWAPGGFATTIGDDVIIGHSAVVHGCQIGNEVLIGMNATVLDGAVIEDQVLLAAGALVPPGKHLSSGGLYAGNPARKIRELSEKERAFFTYSAAHYVQLARIHQQSSEKAI